MNVVLLWYLWNLAALMSLLVFAKREIQKNDPAFWSLVLMCSIPALPYLFLINYVLYCILCHWLISPPEEVVFDKTDFGDMTVTHVAIFDGVDNERRIIYDGPARLEGTVQVSSGEGYARSD